MKKLIVESYFFKNRKEKFQKPLLSAFYIAFKQVTIREHVFYFGKISFHNESSDETRINVLPEISSSRVREQKIITFSF